MAVVTDQSLYNSGDVIVVHGLVDPVETGFAVTMVVRAPNGNLVSIAQFTPASDGTFTGEVASDGPLMQQLGTYTVEAFYMGDSASTMFQLAPPIPIRAIRARGCDGFRAARADSR